MEKPRSTPFYLISSCNHIGKKQFFSFGGGGGVMSDYRHVHLVKISERFLHKGVTLPIKLVGKLCFID